MEDHHTLAPRPAGYPAGYRDGRRNGLPMPEDRRGSGSGSGHETGESSNAGGLRDPMLVHDQTLELPHDTLPLSFRAPGDMQQEDGYAYREERPQRKHRHRTSGGFLLHDKVGPGRIYASRRQRAHVQTPSHSQSQSSGSRDAAGFLTNSSSDRGWRQSSMPSRRSLGEPSNTAMDAGTRRFSDTHSSQQAPPAPDLDSTQIVHMALNLSESRRLAARRNMPRATPPRLVPLPDASSSSNLRQHFQQQRKFSRTISPKPLHESSPRVPSITRIGSPFQPAFDTSHDGQYRWQFSSSTLARAQKAKDHLELLAQYRRLLEVLPPLKPGFERPSTSNQSGSPVATSRPVIFGAQAVSVTLGRYYNPLQYIRNRKVRARERKIIDGERQGFGDVDCVRTWLDTVYRQMSLAGTSLVEDRSTIPPFPGAEEPEDQASPEPTAKTRARRPRVDWFMEPCDMIADAYWLEQEGHKQLIEDRQWRKIFPPTAPDLYRPMSQEVDDASAKATPFSSKANEQMERNSDAKEPGLSKVRSDLSHSSAKERAKQKLQNLKGFHHRHSGSVHGHNKKGSVSEASDNENEVNEAKKRTRQSRKGTISSNTNELLQKQMLEMVAKEARERELAEEADDQGIRTPERRQSSKPPSRFQSRKGSMADASDSDRIAVLERVIFALPVRQSLDDINNNSMGSIGNYSSIPNSPDLQPSRSGNIEAITGVDLSPPWSRSGSPARNPLSKIKQIIRDKSGDSGDSQHGDAEEDGDRRVSRTDSALAPSASASTLDRRQSSPAGKPVSLSTLEGYKTHRSTGSTRLRPDEAIGLRGMFKAPRIDTVIRGGVSKLGDIIWKKDGSSESPEVETTDESDSDRVRGRRRTPLSLSRKTSNRTQDGHQHAPKHFLDSMPQFHHAPDYHHNGASGSAVNSRRSSRFDLLKPPQIDIRSASSSASPPAVRKTRPADSDVSESESVRGSVPEGVRDADRRLNSAIALAKLDQDGRSLSRHLSITDRDLPDRTVLSKREVARMRALILSSGIKAMEIRRRAYEQYKPFSNADLVMNNASSRKDLAGVPWSDIAKLAPRQLELHDRQVAFHELYPLASQTLGIAIQAWGQRWQASADHFTNKTSPNLRKRVWDVRTHLADDLSEMTRKAADEADETSRDLALGQPLKIKHVIDTMEKMLRRRRRRFRWLRRGLWLTVEWLLVGFMWYVWFVVMILRIFLGIGKGLWSGVKWLLWL